MQLLHYGETNSISDMKTSKYFNLILCTMWSPISGEVHLLLQTGMHLSMQNANTIFSRQSHISALLFCRYVSEFTVAPLGLLAQSTNTPSNAPSVNQKNI